MTSLCDTLTKIYECDKCDRFTQSNDELAGLECPYCHKGVLSRKKHSILINWEW